MKRYKVQASYVVYLETEIEIEDDQDPWVWVEGMDNADFEEFDSDNFKIDNIEEVKE